MRRLFNHLIQSLREKPFSYKIAYIQELGEVTTCDTDRLRAIYDGSEYLVGRTVLVDTIRRHQLPVPMTFLRHVATTGNRYFLKNILLMLAQRPSLRTLVRVARHPKCQDDPLLRFLLIQAARAHDIDPNHLEIYVNTEQSEYSDDEAHTWRLWRPLDEIIISINNLSKMAPDTIRLKMWENNSALAEDLGRDLSDTFNIASPRIHELPCRNLGSLLSKYIDLSYLLAQGLRESDFTPFEERIAEECRLQPPGVLLPTEQTDHVPRRADPSLSELTRSGLSGLDEVFPEEGYLSPADDFGMRSQTVTNLSLDDIPFQESWKRVIPRTLAEEMLVIPLHIDGDPPNRLTVGCARGDGDSVEAHLRSMLKCEINAVHLPEAFVREAILRFY